jgi:hypothetical protein
MALAALLMPARAAGPRFYPDDPLTRDNDTAKDASGAREYELSEAFDFLENMFTKRGERTNVKAANVNTVDEVPDSSWFTNRIGAREMPLDEIVRGPDRFERLEVDEWVIVGDKGEAGFQPGFRAVDARHPEQLYQLEVDVEDYPDLSSSAELIGTTLYHAIGYHVVDVYIVNIDPDRIRVGPDATFRDASGRRRYRRGDLDDVLKAAARNPDGTYRMTAGRFVEGQPLGNYKHYGTRPDDPNDIYPHEHRRELRANRVFGAWLNHDDSRALNTLDMLVPEGSHKAIKHYMFDFGSLLGNTPDRRGSSYEYLIEGRSTRNTLLSFGLWAPPWLTIDYPNDLRPYVGLFEGDRFEPGAWKPEYPNTSFDNLRADDGFWAARIVSRFTDEAIRAVVAKARFREPRAADYVAATLIKRRDKVVRHWLTGINPIVDPALSPDGTLTFKNAVVDAGLAGSSPIEYAFSWSRFDNAADAPAGQVEQSRAASTSSAAPATVLEGAAFVTVAIETIHQDYPHWREPVRVYFRRTPAGWQTVGIERQP